jgi:hypothetical protein
MDDKTRKKVLRLEYAIALSTLIAISLTAWKANLTLKQATK